MTCVKPKIKVTSILGNYFLIWKLSKTQIILNCRTLVFFKTFLENSDIMTYVIRVILKLHKWLKITSKLHVIFYTRSVSIDFLIS